MAAHSPRPDASLSTSPTRDYVGGYSDAEAEEFGREDGELSVNNPAVWAANNEPRSINVFNHAHGTTRAMIGHDLREVVQETTSRIDKGAALHRAQISGAVQATNEWKNAMFTLLLLRYLLTVHNLPKPRKRAAAYTALALVLLFAGDLALIAVAFQVLGLSDRPWIPSIAVTDDLHIAALASVAALVILGHACGSTARHLVHIHESRRNAMPDELSRLPKSSILELVISAVFLATAIAALWAISQVRLEYLRALGVSTQAATFLIIQFAVLIAAVAVTYHLTHPLAGRWKDAERAEATATKNRDETIRAVNENTGNVAADIELVNTRIAQAGHHVTVDCYSTARQAELIARRATLSQPEPVTEQLFATPLPGHKNVTAAELLTELTGVIPLPSRQRLNSETLADYVDAAVTAVEQRAEFFDTLQLEKAIGAEALGEFTKKRKKNPTESDVTGPDMQDDGDGTNVTDINIAGHIGDDDDERSA